MEDDIFPEGTAYYKVANETDHDERASHRQYFMKTPPRTRSKLLSETIIEVLHRTPERGDTRKRDDRK